MKDGFDFDGAVKDLFQVDQPTLLVSLARGVAVRAFLNIELPKVQQRRVDLAILLADDTILHIEFHGRNDKDLPYREGMHCLLLSQAYRKPVRQVVIYIGRPKLTMPDHLDAGSTKVNFELMDIRELRAEDLLRTGRPGDIALAVLCAGGAANLKEIIGAAKKLRGAARERVLAMILILAGLRGLSGRVEWEMKHMGVLIDVEKNPVLMRWRKEAIAKGHAQGLAEGREKGLAEGLAEGRAEGREKGRAEGRAEAKYEMLRDQLAVKFGPLPKWAESRIAKASPSELVRWSRKVLIADTLEGVIGKRV